jgi:hypothetical protein
MGNRWDAVRVFFGAQPRLKTAQFATGYQPVNALIEGIMRGLDRVDRAAALGVPAVLRGRNLICSISTLPLELINASNEVQDHPLFRQINPDVANVVTLAQTVEDLLFEAVAWWRVTAFGSDKYPVAAVRYAPDQVSMTPPTGYNRGYLPSGLPTEAGVLPEVGKGVWMGGEFVPNSDVIRFDSPNPALLVAGQRAIKRAIALDAAADLYATNPQARGFFTSADPQADPGEDTDIEGFLTDFAAARRNGVYGYMPVAVKYQEMISPTAAEAQIIDQQRRADLAIANALGIDPEDLGINTTSRTYQNAVDRRKDRINDVLALFMRAITDRLSMPDVTKRGYLARFSLDDYLKADPMTRAQVQQIYRDMEVIDSQDIQREEGLPPRVLRPAVPPTQISAIPDTAQAGGRSGNPGV